MPEKVWKDGCRVTIIEYDVRFIDAGGDCVCVESFETAREAMQFAHDYHGGYAAAAVEKHTSKRPAYMFGGDADKYKTMLTLGDPLALKLWRGE